MSNPDRSDVEEDWLILPSRYHFKKISSAKDLHHILLANSLTADVWKKIGQTIAKFHHHQIYLHDLNIHNIMLDIENEVWLIDFDKCQIRQGSNWKNSNIARLKRSFERKRLHNIYWQLVIGKY